MRLTIAVLLLLFTHPGLTSELYKSENNQQTCPLTICTNMMKDLGAIEEKLNALETRLGKSEAQTEEIKKEILDRPKVAFSAALGSNGFFGPVDADATLVYKDVFINVGDAYNQATGMFTAPVRGLYYFSFFYHCGSRHGTSLALYRNGKLQAWTQHNKSDGYEENGGNGLMLQLEKGDQVYMVLAKDKWIWDDQHITVFSGFLIDAM